MTNLDFRRLLLHIWDMPKPNQYFDTKEFASWMRQKNTIDQDKRHQISTKRLSNDLNRLYRMHFLSRKRVKRRVTTRTGARCNKGIKFLYKFTKQGMRYCTFLRESQQYPRKTIQPPTNQSENRVDLILQEIFLDKTFFLQNRINQLQIDAQREAQIQGDKIFKLTERLKTATVINAILIAELENNGVVVDLNDIMRKFIRHHSNPAYQAWLDNLARMYGQ